VTRYNPSRVNAGEMLSVDDIQEILRVPLIGVIPESESVLQASNSGTPAIHQEKSDVADAYKDVVARFMGEELPMRFVTVEKGGLFKRLFGGR
jgi:septum site-determining protein MinD